MKILPKKSLGQNFLIDESILSKIAELGKINQNDKVLEVGPGTGNLTKKIIEYKPKQLTVIEKDKRLVQYLKNKLPDAVFCMDEKKCAMDTFLRSLKMAGDDPCVHMEEDILITKNFLNTFKIYFFFLIMFFSFIHVF